MKSWSCFVIGTSLVVTVVVIEILTFDVCFTKLDTVDRFDDDKLDPLGFDDDEAYEIREAEEIVFYMVMSALSAGAALEVISLIVLSATYRAPLDAKSAYKIPPNDPRCLAGFMARFLGPLTWGLVCLCMGVASTLYSSYESCGGEEIGEDLQLVFLIVFGYLMICAGALLAALSLLLACTACGCDPPLIGCCCSMSRQFMHRRVLSTGTFFDFWWQLSGVMWSYRTGSLGVQLTIVLLITTVIGEFLSAIGSSAPLEIAEDSWQA